jgi:hypothetical protein
MTTWIVSYIDPGTGGLILQFALGGLAGMAAFIRYHGRASVSASSHLTLRRAIMVI